MARDPKDANPPTAPLRRMTSEASLWAASDADADTGQTGKDVSDTPGLVTFSNVGAPSFPTAAWTTDLAQRLRALLHATPLTDLRERDEHHDPSTRHYDSLTLALRLLDAVVESTGLEDELDHDGAHRVLYPLLRAMDRAANVAQDIERHDFVVRRLLGALLNDKAGREPFDVTYFDAAERGDLVTRHVTFRLLSDYHVAGSGEGRLVLRLSNEAINLVLNALNLDLADAQAAAEAVVDSQLRRGRFDDALQSARNARVRSHNYTRSIDEALERTQRDVRRVDWREQMPQMLQDARIHIELRLRTEDSILEAGEEKLNELAPGSEQAGQVSQIVALMKDCRSRHVKLHGRLMRARGIFLEAQGRQVFAAARAYARPDIALQVLTPILRMTARDAGVAAGSAFSLCHPPASPSVFSLTDFIHYLIRPKRELGAGAVPVVEPDLVEYGSDPTFFSPEVRAAAFTVLSDVTGDATLSELIAGTTRGSTRPAMIDGHTGARHASSAPSASTGTRHSQANAEDFDAYAVSDLITFVVLRAFAPDRPGEIDGIEGSGHGASETPSDMSVEATVDTMNILASDPLLDLMTEFRIEVVPDSVLRVAGYIGDDLRLVRRQGVPSASTAPSTFSEFPEGSASVVDRRAHA